MQGNTLAELLGHTAIIYAVKVLAEKSLVASGTFEGFGFGAPCVACMDDSVNVLAEKSLVASDMLS